MMIIPAIDIRQGKCVMLTQGDVNRETVFSADPAAIAQRWASGGAERLHIIDLDGAFAGQPVNMDVIKKIRKSVSLPLQVGGGIRSLEILDRVMAEDINYAIIGTAAFKNPEFLKQAVGKYLERIIVAVDARGSRVAIAGWTDSIDTDMQEVMKMFSREGVSSILYTDVEKDGMMEGPNWKGIQLLCESSTLRVIASGGITTLKDIKKLAAMNLPNLYGVIIGKAFYTGDIDLKKAIEVTKRMYTGAGERDDHVDEKNNSVS